jgi:enoyl-CoA hydratase/carnithine racemase
MSDTAPRLAVETLADGVVLARLNRPEAKNAVSFEMWREFSALLDKLETETPARALVLYGADNFFSIGGDLKIAPAAGEGALALATRLEWGQRVIARLRRMPIPVIGAVEGGAFGVGWALLMSCDLIIAAEDARFGAPFVDFGLTPDGGAAWFLTQRIGRHATAELLFSGRYIDAKEAKALGLVSTISAPGAALDTARSFASAIGKGNRHAVELTKRLLHGAETGDLEACHALELAYCAILQDGEELARARAAFAAARAKAKPAS